MLLHMDRALCDRGNQILLLTYPFGFSKRGIRLRPSQFLLGTADPLNFFKKQ